MRIRQALVLFLCCGVSCLTAAQSGSKPAAGQSLPVAASSVSTDTLLSGGAAAWKQIALKRVALNRTPPLYDTDEPATLDISSVDVRLARTDGKLFVQLTWHDATEDATVLPEVPNTPPETRFHKVQTEINDRFFDAAAVMFSKQPPAGDITPSLQMGDPEHPVEIYYWNAARGVMLMQAQGRGTTRRTGQNFSASGAYQSGQWSVTFELPDLPAGTPLAFAVWNGSEKDRDGRKYFSVWQVLE